MTNSIPTGLTNENTRFIFVTGGVVSSLGKGLTGAALAALLQARGFSVINQKLDPYLNVDPGTMSPFQHGEVFVTDDGAETDLDLGHYERFTGVPTSRATNYTTGRIYQEIIQRERRGDYLSAAVQVVPHVTDAIKEAIRQHDGAADFVMVEIGGSVGDIESPAYFEAIRQFANDVGRKRCLFMHLTLIPYLDAVGEFKTKPTQHSVKDLLALGIQADVLVCRSHAPVPESDLAKIALFSNLPPEHVVNCPDSDSIYRVPLTLLEKGLDMAVFDHFCMMAPAPEGVERWAAVADMAKRPPSKVRIGVVGKYVQLGDAYKSLNEALTHGGVANEVGVDIDFVDSEALEKLDAGEVAERLADLSGILVPGGFGVRGTEGKVRAITYALENKVPYFGICLGLQMAVVAFARGTSGLGAGLEGAGSTEFNETLGAPQHPVIALMTEWDKGGEKERRGEDTDLGGTMRLGAYPCVLKEGSLAARLYGTTEISERHRHRYEFNNNYWDKLEAAGLIFSGTAPDRRLAEMVELPQDRHPFFIAGQFHPEFKSRPLAPHPLFAGFVAAAVRHRDGGQ